MLAEKHDRKETALRAVAGDVTDCVRLAGASGPSQEDSVCPSRSPHTGSAPCVEFFEQSQCVARRINIGGWKGNVILGLELSELGRICGAFSMARFQVLSKRMIRFSQE